MFNRVHLAAYTSAYVSAYYIFAELG